MPNEILGCVSLAGRQAQGVLDKLGDIVLRSWVIVAVSVAAAWPALAAYLPLVGPGPLRYERTARAPKTPVSVPPEATASAPGEAPSPSPSPSPNPPAPPTAPPTATVEPPPAPPTNSLPAVVEPSPAPPASPTNQAVQAVSPPVQESAEPEITPQMLVQYFKMPAPTAGTNAAGVIVTVPLFQPPQPGRIPPSSARYETPEPRRSTP
jgi:hypothetical protein